MHNKKAVEVKDKISSMMSEMQKFVSAETVVGKPIKSDDITIIPLVDVTFGLGFGFNGKAKEDAQGGGLGGKMSPNSLLIIENGETKLVNVKDSNSIMQMIPQILDRLDLDFIKKPGSSNKKVRFEEDNK